MLSIDFQNTQDKALKYTIRQGNAATIVLQWLDADETPLTLNGFRAEIRDDFAANGGTVVHAFSLTPDPVNGSFYTVDPVLAETDFYLTAEFTATLAANQTYLFEVKQLDAGGKAIESLIAEILVLPEVAKA